MVHNWIQCMPPLAGVFWEFWEFSALKLKLNISKRVFIPLWNAVCGNRLRQIWTSGEVCLRKFGLSLLRSTWVFPWARLGPNSFALWDQRKKFVGWSCGVVFPRATFGPKSVQVLCGHCAHFSSAVVSSFPWKFVCWPRYCNFLSKADAEKLKTSWKYPWEFIYPLPYMSGCGANCATGRASQLKTSKLLASFSLSPISFMVPIFIFSFVIQNAAATWMWKV